MTMTTTEPLVRDGVYSGEVIWSGMVREPDVMSILGSTIPVNPPSTWFSDPGFDGLTPLTISDEGRVSGHIASWKQSHIGLAGGVRAPKSRSGYSFFATGALKCDDGTHINVGQITLAGGHAPLEASVAEAVAHYDNTQSAWCDVAAGEDRHGIWVSGALRPDVDELKLRTIRAASVSGDWRPINGNLELVAVCAVNVPGFPIPRARVASGQVVAMVAAGTEEITNQLVHDRLGVSLNLAVTAAVDTINKRLWLVEDALLDKAAKIRKEIAGEVDDMVDGVVNEIDPDPEEVDPEAEVEQYPDDEVDPEAEQQEYQDGPIEEAEEVSDGGEEDEIAALERRLLELKAAKEPPVEAEAEAAPAEESMAASAMRWDDGMGIGLSITEIAQAQIRMRVKAPALIATATSTWTSDKRRKAAESGVALSDGSFPIRDKKDWEKARHALGRAKDKPRAIRHIKKRGRELGIAKDKVNAVGAS